VGSEASVAMGALLQGFRALFRDTSAALVAPSASLDPAMRRQRIAQPAAVVRAAHGVGVGVAA
jgi:hypothetical protein